MNTLRFSILLAGLLCLALTPCVLANDVVTLNSGEVITGTITSENATQLVIEVANASRTIFTSRSVSKPEIMSIQRETAGTLSMPSEERTTPPTTMHVATKEQDKKPREKMQFRGFVEAIDAQTVRIKDRFNNNIKTFTITSESRIQTFIAQTAVYRAIITDGKMDVTFKDCMTGRHALADYREDGDTLTLVNVLKYSEQPVQGFTGTFEAIDVRRETISVRNYGKNEVKTFTILSEGPYEADIKKLVGLKGNIVDVGYKQDYKAEDCDTLTFVNIREVDNVLGEDGSIFGDHAEANALCSVLSVIKGGLLSKDCTGVSQGHGICVTG